MNLNREAELRADKPPSKKRSWWRYAAWLYFALLILSHLTRLITSTQPELRPGQQRVTLRVVDTHEDHTQHATVTAAYTLIEPQTGSSAITLILLHGSPMASMSMMPLANALPDSFRLLIPDLPGFGRSTLDIPDYSVDAHSGYLIQLMDSLDIEQAHLVAYSMSGGVALQAYDKAPARFQSIVMLSAIGVQEQELLGNYTVNHAVHGLQLGFLWGLQELFPHFGYMDDALLNTSYARNFFDTDQRPLRGILNAYDAPMLILHGSDDMQVPLGAALEHERIVPQSKLATFEGGHVLLFNPSPAFLDTLNTFVASVEAGTALTRSQAPQQRIAKAAEPITPNSFPKAEGLTLLVYLLLIALATLITEDGTCIGAGLLVAQGTIGYIPATIACLVGIVFGDVLLFLAGKHISRPLLTRAPFRWFFSKDAIDSASEWLQKRGAMVIIASRFIPGSRLPTYVAAGTLGLSLWRFLFFFILASLLWTPLLVWFAVIFGEQILTHFLGLYESYALWIFLGLLVAIMLIVKLVVPLFSHQGRRQLVGAWRRKVNWEFWPMWAVYPPVVLYIFYLGLRYRSFTLFTASNPGIDLGGFVGESKTAILKQLASDKEFVPPYISLPPGPQQERLTSLTTFLAESGTTYPFILKPDVGERGKEVSRIKSEQDAKAYLETHTEQVIAQAYAPGDEFGIFYYRYPESSQGKIFSITDKQFPRVRGNGRHTLRRLILDDERAVCMAEHYFRANSDRLFEIPNEGEEIKLIDIGTHSKGAIFLDGKEIHTPELEQTIDEISKGFEGFYFGRFDIRTPNVADLKAGRNFKIVELNGVTSEATHIYDPNNSLFDAWQTLMQQWRIAFEIGHQNRSRGAQPATLREVILRMLRR